MPVVGILPHADIILEMEGYVTTTEAAGIIGCVPRQVRQLLSEGVLKGERVGRDWLVFKESAEKYAKDRPKRGPKPKAPEAKTPKKGKK